MTGVLALALGLAAALYAFVTAHTAWRITHPNRVWRPQDWHPPPLDERRVFFKASDGIRLTGWIRAHDTPHATVVCVHGLGVNRTAIEWRAWRLFQRGFSVMLFDLRGCGASEGRVTTGGALEVYDVCAAVDVCLAQPEFGGAPIVVLADSMGATAAIAAAAQRPEIRALWSDAAFVSLESAIGWGFAAYTGLPPRLFQRAVVALAERFAGAPVSAVDVALAIARIAPRPVMLVHGTDDPLAPCADARRLHAQAGESAELWLEPAAGHVVAGFVDPEVYADRAAAFFTRAAAADLRDDRSPAANAANGESSAPS